jgi:hypothetical protein
MTKLETKVFLSKETFNFFALSNDINGCYLNKKLNTIIISNKTDSYKNKKLAFLRGLKNTHEMYKKFN